MNVSRSIPGPARGAGLVAAALFVAFALIRFDVSFQVSYRLVPVLAVDQVPGRDLANRRAIVDLGGERRAVWVAERYLRVSPGQRACLEERQMLVRPWTRRRLVLPGYCPRTFAPVAGTVEVSGFSAR